MPRKTPTQPAFNRVRNPKRASYDRAQIDPILDAGLVGHFGFVAEDRPMVIPMAYARDGDVVYLHGATKTRAMNQTNGLKACLTVTILDGIVAARSAFHHSVNYRSVVIHGTAHIVTDRAERNRALQLITEHLLPGRYEEVRPITPQEDKATGVLALHIEAASAKIRSGPPVDDDADLPLGLWGGVLPITTALGRGVPDGHTPEGMAEPPSFAEARVRFAR